RAKLSRTLPQSRRARATRRAPPLPFRITQVHAIGAGVLRDDQQLAHTAPYQALGLPQYLVHRSRYQVPAQRRDDAEGASVIAAFGNLQVRVVLRRKLDAGIGHQAGEGIVPWRQRLVHGLEHADVVLWPADRQHAGVRFPDQVGTLAQAAGDDDLAILGDGLADGLERFVDRSLDEA